MFNEDERAYLIEMRAITTNTKGQEVLIGLTLEETKFYMNYINNKNKNQHNDSDTARYLELHDKHEIERQNLLVAENQLRVDKPQRH